MDDFRSHAIWDAGVRIWDQGRTGIEFPSADCAKLWWEGRHSRVSAISGISIHDEAHPESGAAVDGDCNHFWTVCQMYVSMTITACFSSKQLLQFAFALLNRIKRKIDQRKFARENHQATI